MVEVSCSIKQVFLQQRFVEYILEIYNPTNKILIYKGNNKKKYLNCTNSYLA